MVLEFEFEVFWYFLKIFLEAVDLQAQLLQSFEIWKELEFEIFFTDANVVFDHGAVNRLDRFLKHLLPLLILGRTHLFVKVVEVVLAVDGRLTLDSPAPARHLLLLLGCLLHDEVLDLLLLLTKILILKLESVNGLQREVESILLFVHFCLHLRGVFELVVALNAFFDYLVDVDILTDRTNFIVLLLNNFCCTMKKNLFVFLFG